MSGVRYEFESPTFRWEVRRDLWVFAELPQHVSDEIADMPLPPAGWDSVPVTVTLGQSRWRTSIFPSEGRYVVALKKAIRVKEGVELGDRVRLGIELD